MQQSFVWPHESEVTMVVQRGDEEISLKGTAGTPVVTFETLVPAEDENDAQSALRGAWMKG